MYSFEIESPTSVADAVAALGKEEAQALAGGQTLIPSLKARLAAPSVLVSLAKIDEIRGVSIDGDTVTIGGGASAYNTNGTNSSFDSTASTGGGFGAWAAFPAYYPGDAYGVAASGGSGGGGAAFIPGGGSAVPPLVAGGSGREPVMIRPRFPVGARAAQRSPTCRGSGRTMHHDLAE